MPEQDNKKKAPPIKSAEKMKKLMADHFLEIDQAAKDKSRKIAWCTSVGPAEILRAMDFLVYFPENHGAMLGATRMANAGIEAANAAGYSPDICSYLTADVGSYMKKQTPLTKAYGIASIPKPDVLVYNTNQCRDVKDWFSYYAREFNVPITGVNTYRSVGPVTATHVAAVAGQMREMIPVLENVSGKKLDPAKLEETVALSAECSRLWKAVLDTAAGKPAPLSFFDGTIHMGPAVVMRGTKEANEYYRKLLSEMQERIKGGVAAVEGERFRIYWEGMPVWGKLRELSDICVGLKTTVVASTYCNSWIFEAFDPKEPFESMARAYTELFIVRSDDVKEDYISRMVKFFGADGIIFHDSKTCPNNSNNRYAMPQRLTERLKVPTLTIFADLNDLRCYSAEQTRTNIEAFVEQLSQSGGATDKRSLSV